MNPQYFFLAIFLPILIYERIYSTFSKTERRIDNVYDQIFTSSMILIYGLVITTGVIDFLNQQQFYPIKIGIGLIVFCIGVALRVAARKALGGNWSIYITVTPKRMIKLGPYNYSRHPYYLGTFLELTSFGIIFQSRNSLLLVLFIYLPFVLVRILIEEKMLRMKFGIKHLRYCIQTPLIISFAAIQGNQFLKIIRQIGDVWRFFGPKRLKTIKHLDWDITQYARNYYIAQTLAALIKTGLVDYLMLHNKANLKKYTEENNHDFSTLKKICDYLSIVRVMKKEGVSYSFTHKGERLVRSSRGVFSLIYAYAPIFENLDKIIESKIKYGKDIHRRGEFVGRGSAELARIMPFPTSLRLMKKYNCQSILDLGCGSGEFLIDICQNNGIKGYGIDLSPEAINFAKSESERKGLNKEKIHFETGDVFKLDQCLEKVDHVDMVSSMFVLHEFIRNGNYSDVVKILVEIRKRFPRSLILICELCRAPLSQLQKRASGVAEHHLFHSLSNQEIASLKEWRQIFKEAKLKLCEEYRFDLAEQGYFILQNTLNL